MGAVLAQGEEMKEEKRKAGRPPAPPRPKPISWRPDTQAQRDKWLELGGARWAKRLINEALLQC